jgi:pimeloyl-ACP methyl ester carboxylesterase
MPEREKAEGVAMAGEKNIRLYIESEGNGRPIALIHGFGANMYTWRFLRKPLSEKFKTIALDLKGFGKSPKPRDDAYSLIDQIDLAEEAILDRSSEPVVLMGQSYGGAVCLGLAARWSVARPEMLRGLIIIDGAAYPQEMPIFFKLLKMPGFANFGLGMISRRLEAQFVLRHCYFNKSLITNEQIDKYAEPLNDKDAPQAMAQIVKQIIPTDANGFCEAYKRITAPALIVWGRQDAVIPLEIGRRLARDLPNAELVVLEKCGHVPNEERPVETLKIIETFLNKIENQAKDL